MGSVELLERVSEALRTLSSLNEAPVSAGFDASVHGGDKDHDVRETDTALDYHVRALERWCREAEARVAQERKGQANASGQIPELSMEQKRWRLIHSGSFEGRRAGTAARLLDVDVEQICRWRGQVGLDEQTGRKK